MTEATRIELINMRKQRVAKWEETIPGFENLSEQEQYEIDDGDRLLEGIDILLGRN